MTVRRAPGAVWALALLLVAAAGCASKGPTVERASHSPSARELYVARSYQLYQREPNFDERSLWENELDLRIASYLRSHPELEQSPRYTEFRFLKHATPGSTRGEVRTLLEEPREETVDPDRMAALAKRHWAELHTKAKEAWVYPAGWVLYFDDTAVIAILRSMATR